MALRVLTWNLLHGRSVPPAGRYLLGEFSALLAAWDWDVALLQEVPPWWAEPLAARAGAESRSVLTSRNALLPLRRALAVRHPDAIKSNGGGSNAILIRGAHVLEHRVKRLCWFPERRWMHAVRSSSDVWFGNLHASKPHGSRGSREALLAANTISAWAGEGSPIVLGGDFNQHWLQLPGFVHAGGFEPDHVFVRGRTPAGVRTLDRGILSDHTPVVVTLE